jgi:hypothetical protein
MKGIYTFCVLMFFLLACKKEKIAKTKTELLTSASWHVINYIIDPAVDWDGDGAEEMDVYTTMQPCLKDDFSTFFTDGKGEIDEGPTKCNTGGPQKIPFNWEFFQGDSLLKVQGIIYHLETLTENQLVVKEIEAISTTTYIHTVTFAH